MTNSSKKVFYLIGIIIASIVMVSTVGFCFAVKDDREYDYYEVIDKIMYSEILEKELGTIEDIQIVNYFNIVRDYKGEDTIKFYIKTESGSKHTIRAVLVKDAPETYSASVIGYYIDKDDKLIYDFTSFEVEDYDYVLEKLAEEENVGKISSYKDLLSKKKEIFKKYYKEDSQYYIYYNSDTEEWLLEQETHSYYYYNNAYAVITNDGTITHRGES